MKKIAEPISIRFFNAFMLYIHYSRKQGGVSICGIGRRLHIPKGSRFRVFWSKKDNSIALREGFMSRLPVWQAVRSV